ncbi:hypothetical protein JHW43_004820 [Diplocarpon mali]|nr:hypothetical protein JHW43_004820 [Diplocarpon mali]
MCETKPDLPQPSAILSSRPVVPSPTGVWRCLKRSTVFPKLPQALALPFSHGPRALVCGLLFGGTFFSSDALLVLPWSAHPVSCCARNDIQRLRVLRPGTRGHVTWTSTESSWSSYSSQLPPSPSGVLERGALASHRRRVLQTVSIQDEGTITLEVEIWLFRPNYAAIPQQQEKPPPPDPLALPRVLHTCGKESERRLLSRGRWSTGPEPRRQLRMTDLLVGEAETGASRPDRSARAGVEMPERRVSPEEKWDPPGPTTHATADMQAPLVSRATLLERRCGARRSFRTTCPRRGGAAPAGSGPSVNSKDPPARLPLGSHSAPTRLPPQHASAPTPVASSSPLDISPGDLPPTCPAAELDFMSNLLSRPVFRFSLALPVLVFLGLRATTTTTPALPHRAAATMSTALRAPVISVCHGGGPLPALGDPDHREVIRSLGERVPQVLRLGTAQAPRAIVLVTAHWQERNPTISNGASHPLYYDYGGMDRKAYELKYPAPGSPAVADEVRAALQAAGFQPQMNARRGWDHGVFIPMLVINPKADVPIVQLSILSSGSPAQHFAMGRALAGLRDTNVAIVASGMSGLHNMRAMFGGQWHDGGFRRRNQEWLERLDKTVKTEDPTERGRLLESWRDWTGAKDAHPVGGEDHFLPLIVAAGAGGAGKAASYVDQLTGMLASKQPSFYWE